MYPDTKPAEEDMEEDQEPRELQDADIEELKKTLKPGEGLIQRDDEGNVIRVIVGEAKSHNDILDAEPEPVEAKTDVVRGRIHLLIKKHLKPTDVFVFLF